MKADREELLSLYKIVVETIGQNESKRLQANSTYVGFAGALVTIAATVQSANIAILAFIGLILSWIWFFTIKFHRDLATAKFAVIEKFEKQLPRQPFKEEWESYKSVRWKMTLTQIELVAPVSVGFACLCYLVWKLIYS